jgi:hypothetical protein
MSWRLRESATEMRQRPFRCVLDVVRFDELEMRKTPLLFTAALALGFAGAFPVSSGAQSAKWGVNDGLQADPSHYSDFATWLGKPQLWNVTWADKQYTWQNEVTLISSFGARLVLWHNAGRGITISMPMVIPKETLATGNSGADDANWTLIGQYLVADGVGDATIRLGWEFNGGWYPWRARRNGVTDFTNWTGLFQRIVTLLRAVPGASFKFDWCPSMTGSNMLVADIEAIYPGDSYVDYIGMDIYNYVNLIPKTWKKTSWEYWTTANQGINLDWLASVAASHGKKISVPEWGQTQDDPDFIANMAAWFRGKVVVYQNYFSTGNYSLNQQPNSKAAFYAAFHPRPPKVETTPVGVTVYRGP